MKSDENKQELVVLAVDDEDYILKVYRRMFMNEDYDLIVTTNPTESLGLIEGRNLAVVLSDYDMPNMKGDELLAKIQELHPDVTRMLISGSHSLNNGLAHYNVEKPFSMPELITTVRKGIEDYIARCETSKAN